MLNIHYYFHFLATFAKINNERNESDFFVFYREFSFQSEHIKQNNK